ncbi:MAG: hypothetical protein WBD41_01465 [Rhodococcus sp. (in: high G+C Gram-positive bacteria)]
MDPQSGRECAIHDVERHLAAEDARREARTVALACVGYVVGMLAIFNGALPIVKDLVTVSLVVSLAGTLLAAFSALTLALLHRWPDHSDGNRRGSCGHTDLPAEAVR